MKKSILSFVIQAVIFFFNSGYAQTVTVSKLESNIKQKEISNLVRGQYGLDGSIEPSDKYLGSYQRNRYILDLSFDNKTKGNICWIKEQIFEKEYNPYLIKNGVNLSDNYSWNDVSESFSKGTYKFNPADSTVTFNWGGKYQNIIYKAKLKKVEFDLILETPVGKFFIKQFDSDGSRTKGREEQIAINKKREEERIAIKQKQDNEEREGQNRQQIISKLNNNFRELDEEISLELNELDSEKTSFSRFSLIQVEKMFAKQIEILSDQEETELQNIKLTESQRVEILKNYKDARQRIVDRGIEIKTKTRNKILEFFVSCSERDFWSNKYYFSANFLGTIKEAEDVLETIGNDWHFPSYKEMKKIQDVLSFTPTYTYTNILSFGERKEDGTNIYIYKNENGEYKAAFFKEPYTLTFDLDNQISGNIPPLGYTIFFIKSR